MDELDIMEAGVAPASDYLKKSGRDGVSPDFHLYLANVLREEKNKSFLGEFLVSSEDDLKQANQQDCVMGEMMPTRKKSNWKGSDCLFVDIDGGMSLLEFQSKMKGTATSPAPQGATNLRRGPSPHVTGSTPSFPLDSESKTLVCMRAT